MVKNMIILYGGKSCEKDVSIITALQIYKKYNVKDWNKLLVFIDENGRWFSGRGLDEFKFYKTKDCAKLTEVCIEVGSNSLFKKSNNKRKELFKIDFILNCCHGGDGENGNLTALFEMCGIPSSTGGADSLMVMMDKYLTKEVLLANDLPTVDFFVIEKNDWITERDKIKTQISQFGLPVVVKPVRQGSSVGVCLIEDIKEFDRAVNLGFDFGTQVLVEKAIIKKREFNIAVKTKNGKIVTSLIEEPVTSKTIISFDDKYKGGGRTGGKLKGGGQVFGGMETSERKFPVVLSKKLEGKIENIAKQFYETVSACGVVRIDFLYDTETGKLYLGEANAIPGSLGFYFFDKEDFLKDIVEEGLAFWRKKFLIKYTTPLAKIF